MSAITHPIPATNPIHRSLWARVGFTLVGAALGVAATLVITDDDSASSRTAPTETVARDAGVVSSAGASMSADAVERWSTSGRATSGSMSADATERWSTGAGVASTSGSMSADASERWSTGAGCRGLSPASAQDCTADQLHTELGLQP
jgi:uncharacterized protein involved in type VI secretion and phage assembly